MCDECTERYTETSASHDPSAGYLHSSTLRGDSCDSRADVSNQLAILGLNEYVKFRYNELFLGAVKFNHG